VLIAAPAAVAIWSGWVGLGGLCGFGPVRVLPGITGLTINTAITLPVGVEAYAAFALGAWMAPGTPPAARRFARWSALGALAYGMAGQIIYHLLAAAHATAAPWPVVVVVSCMPVAVLGLAAALTHLLRQDTGPAINERAGPAVNERAPVPAAVPLPSVREIRDRRKCSQATALKIRAELKLLTRNPPAGAVAPAIPPAPAGASPNGSAPHGTPAPPAPAPWPAQARPAPPRDARRDPSRT
jgi:hypothetical protein